MLGRNEKQVDHAPNSSYQNYLFGSAGTTDRPAWSDTIHGRAAIRTISRGIVGSMFFTVGGRIARAQMESYHPDLRSTRPLHRVAKLFDKTIGAAIEKTVTAAAELKYGKDAQIAKDIGKRAVTFRDTRRFMNALEEAPTQLNQDRGQFGRSYGAEVVSFTFDFAMASVGDATTRNVIQAFDPNIKKAWLVNDEGKPAVKGEHKHIKWGLAAKSFAHAAWRVASNNQLEDWVAAIPYAYQMKLQRHLISKVMDKRFDGHQIVFDENWNGGAYKWGMKPDGTQGIVGDYMLPGAIDLHLRFTGYNWYTLMFREGYDRIGRALNQWKDDGYALHMPKMPEHFNPITSTIDSVGQSMRYVTKSFIKANMYMNPAVIPFWVMRVSQSPWRGKQYMDMTSGVAKRGEFTHVFDSTEEYQKRLTLHQEQEAAAIGHEGMDFPSDKLRPYESKYFDGYPNTLETKFSKAMHRIGGAQDSAGKWMGKRFASIGKNGERSFGNVLNEAIIQGTNEYSTHAGNEKYTIEERRKKGLLNMGHEFMDASFAYTPYMFAKGETALMVDDRKGKNREGLMDQAIYGWMHNVATFNLHGTWNSTKKMWKLGTHYEDKIVREGTSVTEDKPSATVSSNDMPENKILAKSIVRGTPDPASLSRANDNDATANDNDHADDKSWVSNIAGRNLNPALIHSASATRH